MISEEDQETFLNGWCAELAAGIFSELKDDGAQLILFSNDPLWNDWTHAAVLIGEFGNQIIVDAAGEMDLADAFEKWGNFFQTFDNIDAFLEAVGYDLEHPTTLEETVGEILETIVE